MWILLSNLEPKRTFYIGSNNNRTISRISNDFKSVLNTVGVFLYYDWFIASTTNSVKSIVLKFGRRKTGILIKKFYLKKFDFFELSKISKQLKLRQACLCSELRVSGPLLLWIAKQLQKHNTITYNSILSR